MDPKEDSKLSLEQLIARYGSGIDIPEDALRHHGFMRFERPTGAPSAKSIFFRTVEEWSRSADEAKGALTSLRGYLFGRAEVRMDATVAGKDCIEAEELSAMLQRAQRMKKAGIPPIFSPSYVVSFIRGNGRRAKPYSFPLVDFIIQYGAGVYEERCAAFSMSQIEQGRNRNSYSREMIQPTVPEDVFVFRGRAFEATGLIEEALTREIVDYAAEHFQFKDKEEREESIGVLKEALAFLEHALRKLPHSPRTYQTWDGSYSRCFERRWYLDYDHETRLRMMQGLVARHGAPDEKEADRTLTERVAMGLMGTEAQTLHAQVDQRDVDVFSARLERYIASKDLSTFTDWERYYKSSLHHATLMEGLARFAHMMGEALLQDAPEKLKRMEVDQGAKLFRLPPGTSGLTRVKELCLVFKIRAWQRIDQDAFLKASKHYFYKPNKVDEYQRRFVAYVLERRKTILEQPKP